MDTNMAFIFCSQGAHFLYFYFAKHNQTRHIYRNNISYCSWNNCSTIFLYGINGVLLQLIDLKAKWKVLKAKNLPNYIMSLTRKGKQLQPEACCIIMNSLKDKDIQNMFVRNYSVIQAQR